MQNYLRNIGVLGFWGFGVLGLKLDRRGALKPGCFADVVVFDPATIQDHATFEQPHQYATGMRDVFVNGVQVLSKGDHTGAKPGRLVGRVGAQAMKTYLFRAGCLPVLRHSRSR